MRLLLSSRTKVAVGGEGDWSRSKIVTGKELALVSTCRCEMQQQIDPQSSGGVSEDLAHGFTNMSAKHRA